MNRFRGGGGWSAAAPSKASPSTQCQKCLQRGHYSYECKASQTERPYISRPSRTQQLFDPTVRQKLTMAAPPQEKSVDLDLKSQWEPSLFRAGIADEILAKKDKERSSKRRRESPSLSPVQRHSRSPSTSSVSSYSSISSGRSPSPRTHSTTRRTRSPGRRVRRRLKDSPSPAHRGRRLSADSGRRRTRTRSRSPLLTQSRRRSRTPIDIPPAIPKKHTRADRRSLSPFSRRVALTKAMGHSNAH